MEYQGYIAQVEYDEIAGEFHGRVVNAGPYPIASFAAATPGQLPEEFRKSVDLYLQSCAADGIPPREPGPAPPPRRRLPPRRPRRR